MVTIRATNIREKILIITNVNINNYYHEKCSLGRGWFISSADCCRVGTEDTTKKMDNREM